MQLDELSFIILFGIRCIHFSASEVIEAHIWKANSWELFVEDRTSSRSDHFVNISQQLQLPDFQ